MLPADSKLACICPHLKISLHGGINALVDHTLPQVLLQPCTPAAAVHLPLPVTPTSRLISRREPSLTGGPDREDTGSPPVGDISVESALFVTIRKLGSLTY